MKKKIIAAITALVLIMSCVLILACAEGLYTIRFETFGGSMVETQKVAAGESIKTPETPQKNGYVFEGWYTVKKDFSEENKWNFSKSVEKSMVLYANWVEESALKIFFDKITDAKGNFTVSETVSYNFSELMNNNEYQVNGDFSSCVASIDDIPAVYYFSENSDGKYTEYFSFNNENWLKRPDLEDTVLNIFLNRKGGQILSVLKNEFAKGANSFDETDDNVFEWNGELEFEEENLIFCRIEITGNQVLISIFSENLFGDLAGDISTYLMTITFGNATVSENDRPIL